MSSQWQPISDLAAKVCNGELKAVDLIERALKTIHDKKEFDAVISTTEKRAREMAEKIDHDIKEGQFGGRLAGVPFVAKDNFLTFGSETTAASNILKGFKAPYQATAVERLEAEGAICVAKANLDAFAHGASTENSDFMITKNPFSKKHVPGGSSGGSAAAVILDMVPFALGSDTGGSIRLPASFCGAVGYKPTYGLVSRSGVVAMASSTDVIGPITKNVIDAAVVMDVISGKDPLDSTTINRDKQNYADFDKNISGKTIGIIDEYMGNGVDEAVREKVNAGLKILEKKGAKLLKISLPSLPLALACYYIICPAEVSSNLSRYDGQRFGFSAEEAVDVDQSFTLSRSRGFGAEAKRRIMIGSYVLSSGYYDAYYRQAQLVRTKLINETNEAFKKVDFLAGPVSPTTAFKIGQNIDDPLKMYLVDIMTVAASLTGIPAISVPVGKSNQDNMPVGLQLMAPQSMDRRLLSLAAWLESGLNEL
ncbi:MAG: Asp-tRNA(Asn)/Glu-tRNA(Gln) amidotransferase subunit GatA [Patescibacteria group bacterium]